MIQSQQGSGGGTGLIGLSGGITRRIAWTERVCRNASHLYHLHPPNQWNRIEGPLKPHRLQSYLLKPEDLSDSQRVSGAGLP